MLLASISFMFRTLAFTAVSWWSTVVLFSFTIILMHIVALVLNMGRFEIKSDPVNQAKKIYRFLFLGVKVGGKCDYIVAFSLSSASSALSSLRCQCNSERYMSSLQTTLVQIRTLLEKMYSNLLEMTSRLFIIIGYHVSNIVSSIFDDGLLDVSISLPDMNSGISASESPVSCSKETSSSDCYDNPYIYRSTAELLVELPHNQ